MRHTVGLADPLTAADLAAADRLNDGLPETLEEAIAAYGHRFFKLKIAGDPEADVARLARIAAVLDRLDAYQVTLDGNEQYPDPATVAALPRPPRRRARPRPPARRDPLPRAADGPRRHPRDPHRPRPSRSRSTRPTATIDAFPPPAALGYRGVSSKSCKGFTRALLNRARVAA